MSGLVIFFSAALVVLIALLTAMLMWEMTHPPRHTAAYAIARNLASSPDELGLSYETWILDRPDGARLPVWDIKRNQRSTLNAQRTVFDAPRLTVVFLHGWGHSRIDALARLKPYHDLGDRLILYDLRGHGDSERCVSRLGHREQDDLIELLGRINDDQVILVGHSMGAVIAMRAVIDAPRPVKDRILGVVAYGPYCEFHRTLIGRLNVAEFPTRPITDLALLMFRLVGIRPSSVNEDDFRGWGVPLRVIHGDRDDVAPIEHARRVAGAAGPSAQLHVISGAAHTDAHIVDSVRHDEIIRRFFDYLRAER